MKDTKELTRKSDLKFRVIEISKREYSSDKSLMKLVLELWPEFQSGDSKKRGNVRPQVEKEVKKLVIAYDLENQYALAKTVKKDYRALVVDFGRQVIAEFDCKSPSEKALAELVASGFVRYLVIARKLTLEWSNENISQDRTRYIGLLSKDLDRAMRTFISALTTLKQFKNPSSSIKVNATAAFIADKQQVNVSSKEGK